VRGVPLGVAVVAAALYFLGLSSAPFLDPPEGFHAEIARNVVATGDWTTLRLDGVRYFDKPPLQYWLMAGSFAVAGPTPLAARFWPALAAVACAAVTAQLGVLLGGARLGLLAGLMVAANLGIFLYGRIVKPDLIFIFCIVLAYEGFALAYQGKGRWALGMFYASLGLAALAKDLMGAIGPLATVGVFLALTRERPLGFWFPWWGGLLLAGVALPWYLAVEAANHGFLWYTVVDNHFLNFTRERVFPDEDVPLNSLEFIVVTAAAFLPWSLAVPFGLGRTLRRPWSDATARLWVVFAIWPIAVLGFFTVSPFKLPHYGLPAFPALALVAARVWDESIAGTPGALRPRRLLLPLLATFAVTAIALSIAAAGLLPVVNRGLATVDVATRNVVARGGIAPGAPPEAWQPLIIRAAVILGLAACGIAVALRRRSAGLGVGVALAGTIAFLPIAGEGMAQFARLRSARPIVDALVRRVQPDDLVAHEGPLEDTASALLALRRRVHVVNGLESNLAFGATFPDARDVFWDASRLSAHWTRPPRLFLISVVAPAKSVVRTLPDSAVHLIAEAGGRRLYSNRGD
jgi:4-amino-4-deoxy-L-arabinose transferase-like glycosyltransferase